MPSSQPPQADSPKQATDAVRLSPADLIAQLRHRHRSSGAIDTAMLVVHLNRSDRLNAFGQQADARPVLIEVSRRVRDMLRPDDLFALVTPDEIWILLCSVNGVALAELAARTLRERLMRPIQVAQHLGG